MTEITSPPIVFTLCIRAHTHTTDAYVYFYKSAIGLQLCCFYFLFMFFVLELCLDTDFSIVANLTVS